MARAVRPVKKPEVAVFIPSRIDVEVPIGDMTGRRQVIVLRVERDGREFRMPLTVPYAMQLAAAMFEAGDELHHFDHLLKGPRDRVN